MTASDKAALDAYADACLHSPKSVQVHVDGYASVDGQESYNQALSVKRAQAVMDYLVGKGLQKASVVIAGHGETHSFSKDDPRQNRRVTLGPPVQKAKDAPDAPPGGDKPGPSGGKETPPPAPGPAPVIKHETEAKQPSNRARTKLGVGERVTMTVEPGPGTWTASKGTLSAKTGAKIIFTAPGKPDKVDVTVTVNGQEDKVQFEVIAPSDVHMDANGTRHMANGRPNAGFHADIYLLPGGRFLHERRIPGARCRRRRLRSLGAVQRRRPQPRHGLGHDDLNRRLGQRHEVELHGQLPLR